MSVICGIDVGLSGAIAFLDDDGNLVVHDIPTVEVVRKVRRKIAEDDLLDGGPRTKTKAQRRRELDLYETGRIIDATGPIRHAFVEQVTARPTDGPVQAGAFLGVYWGIRGILAANFVPVTLVAPAAWRKGMKIPPPKTKGDKGLVVAAANDLFPRWSYLWRAKCHADRAEAALIAEYGRRERRGRD